MTRAPAPLNIEHCPIYRWSSNRCPLPQLLPANPSTITLAIAESASLGARAVAAAVKSLAQAASAAVDPAERNRLAESAELLKRSEPAATQAFPALLREEIESASTASAAAGKPFSFESLELMGDDQVDDTVELLRGQQAVTAAVEADLVAFNALVSAAQGHERVSAATNPLRPDVWVRALHRALGRAHAVPAARSSWMLHVGRAMGPELAALYRSLCDDMKRQGISAAAYRITPQDEARRRARGDSTGPTLRELKRLLANVTRGDGDTQGLTRPAGQTLNGMTMPAAMEALQGMKQMDDVVRRMQERWRQGVWKAEPAAAGDGDAGGGSYSPTQTLAREVARLMLANVAANERLLPDVQEAVRELEPALLRLVQHDQRFFVDRQHPARQLLEEMTQRSLAWPQRGMPGFMEFFAPLRDAVQMLAQMPLEDEEPFVFALQMLRQSWDEAAERTRRQRASMARTLIKADARNHAAAEFAPRVADRTIAWDGQTQPWLTPEELADPGLTRAAPQAPAGEFEPTQRDAGSAAPSDSPRGASPAGDLLPGQYIEVQAQGKWTRWRMTWASPHGLMLMFVDASGRPESMTRQMLDTLVDMGAIRLLPSNSVVDGALDAVAQTALENSTQRE